jgi:hypothetical protein
MTEPLPKRMRGDERLELRDDRPVAAECEVRLDPILLGDDPALLQSLGLTFGEGLERDVGERGASPFDEGLAKLHRRTRRIVGVERPPSLLGKPLEPGGVERAGFESKPISGALRREDVADAGSSQDLPELRDVDLQRVLRRRRNPLAPQAVDELVDRDDLVQMDDEDREQRALLGPTEGKWSFIAEDLEGAKDPNIHVRLAPTDPTTRFLADGMRSTRVGGCSTRRNSAFPCLVTGVRRL